MKNKISIKKPVKQRPTKPFVDKIVRPSKPTKVHNDATIDEDILL